MLAVMNGHKDVVLLLMQKGANPDHVNNVSVNILILYLKVCITVNKKAICLSLKDCHYVLYKGLIVFKSI